MVEGLNSVKIKYDRKDDSAEKQAIIASFSSHIPIANLDDMEINYTRNSAAYSLLKKRQRKLECVSSDSRVKYTGLLDSKESFSGLNSCKHYVGVYNKKKNKLQILDSNYFEMNLFNEEEEQKFKKDLVENKNKIRDRLIKAFGSTKGKRLIDSRERNAVVQESYESSIGAAINNSKIEMNGLEDDDVDNSRNSDSTLDYLPKHNLNALKVQDIYPINQIISEAEMDALATPAIVFTESTMKLITEWSNNKTYPSFICDRLKYLPVDDAAKAKRCKQFMYLRYLLFLYSLKYSSLRKKEFMPSDIPPLVKSSMIAKFTIPVAGHKFARSIPPKTKDSILFHILVLCLHIDDFSLNVSDLNSDLPGKDLLKYLRLLGCKVTVNRCNKSVKNDAKAILTVPLTFPIFSPSKTTKRKKN